MRDKLYALFRRYLRRYYGVRQPLWSQKSTTEYMLAVYNSASADFRRNEEFGDKRVNLYITLTTVVLGSLIVLVTRQFISSLQILIPAIAFGIAVVLSIGVSTFSRIIERNKQTDQYIRVMRDVGKFFVLRDPTINPFLIELNPFKSKKRRSDIIKLTSFATGGYLQTVAILNSLVAAALPLLTGLALMISNGTQSVPIPVIGFMHYIWWLAIGAVLIAIGTWWLQIDHAKRIYVKDEKKRAPKRRAPR